MEPTPRKAALQGLLEPLHSAARLRAVSTGLMLLVGYAGIYLPLSARIDETARNLNNERKRQDLCCQVEGLRAQVDKFAARLPEKTDTNEWVQYLLSGIRRFPLHMLALDSGVPQRIGPYKAVVFHVELEGAFRDLDAFLHWLETNQRLFRVDAAKIVPVRGSENRVTMQLTLSGLKS
jgi:type II secretory pathway component PulM